MTISHTLKILHLEDSANDAELVGRFLKNAKLNCEIKVVDTKIDFQNSLKYFDPDIILSDHTLPQFNSVEALRIVQVRKNDIPFILVTGTVSEEFAAACIKSGAYDYILKKNLSRLPNAIEQGIRQKEAAEKIKASENRLRITLDNLLEGVQIIGFDFRYQYVNDVVAKQGKYSKEELLGNTMMEKYPGIENTDLFRALKASMEDRITRFLENEFSYSDGTKGWFELSIQPVPEGLFILSIDITERKKAHEKLLRAENEIRHFARHLNNVLEEERAHLAREIHDELGQRLAGIKIGIGSFKKINGIDPRTEEKIAELMNEVDITIQSLRQIATELRPGILDSMGLIPSIQWLAKEFEKKTGIKCFIENGVEDKMFEKNLSTCFFRISQEALTNISKHAQASEIRIRTIQNDKELLLEISDNGKGISGEKLNNPFSMGLLGMRERANIIGADFMIESENGKGTTVMLKKEVS